MPKIQAATVAEHRANQRRSILDAAHSILEETGDIPNLRVVAERAGIARPSVYTYFPSLEALLNSLVQDVFPKWTERITGAMDAETDASSKVVAYALANLDLVAEGAHAVGSALAALSPGEALDAEASRMHRAIQEPLVDTMQLLEADDPEGMSELINAIIHASTRMLESGKQLSEVRSLLVSAVRPIAVELHDQRRVRARTKPAGS